MEIFVGNVMYQYYNVYIYYQDDIVLGDRFLMIFIFVGKCVGGIKYFDDRDQIKKQENNLDYFVVFE